MKLSHCRSCAAPIIWTVTTNGKRMPVDADPVVAPKGFRLDTLGEDTQDQEVTATFTAAPDPQERLYLSHFSTCPDANQHRRTS